MNESSGTPPETPIIELLKFSTSFGSQVFPSQARILQILLIAMLLA